MSGVEGVVQCQAYRRVVFDNWGLGSAGINGGSEDETSKKTEFTPCLHVRPSRNGTIRYKVSLKRTGKI